MATLSGSETTKLTSKSPPSITCRCTHVCMHYYMCVALSIHMYIHMYMYVPSHKHWNWSIFIRKDTLRYLSHLHSLQMSGRGSLYTFTIENGSSRPPGQPTARTPWRHMQWIYKYYAHCTGTHDRDIYILKYMNRDPARCIILPRGPEDGPQKIVATSCQ
jgi:hypothetical protein